MQLVTRHSSLVTREAARHSSFVTARRSRALVTRNISYLLSLIFCYLLSAAALSAAASPVPYLDPTTHTTNTCETYTLYDGLAYRGMVHCAAGKSAKMQLAYTDPGLCAGYTATAGSLTGIQGAVPLFTLTMPDPGEVVTIEAIVKMAIPYVDPTDPDEPDKTAVCVPLTNDGTTRLDLTDGWYAVTENVNDISTFNVIGDVNLILCDGCTLHDDWLVCVNPGGNLTIWGQTEGTGTLSANGTSNHAPGIQNTDASVTINGGTVIATGGYQCAGIGGLYEYDEIEIIENGGTLTVNGGTVVATGGSGAAGIGGGENGDCGRITITGGTVTAIAGSHAQAIGPVHEGGESGNLIIDGMKVTNPAGTLAAGRIDACRGAGVTLVPCLPHEYDGA